MLRCRNDLVLEMFAYCLMKYQIDSFTLDVKARTLSDNNSHKNIRPKTLAVLLYLAKKSGVIVSKQELLAEIWDDVNVDDGVIFQSVREIRQLFANTQIIQNHPRKGYEFTSEIALISQSKALPINRFFSSKKYLLSFSITLILVLAMLFSYVDLNNVNDEGNTAYQQKIVILPMKNHVHYGENVWLYLGGMEQLTVKLKGLPSSIFVYQATNILRLMHMAGLEREFSSADIGKMFDASGATLIVETDIHGNAFDYKLIYKFHLDNDIKQGVILDTSINGALTKLSEKISRFINQPLRKSAELPNTEFSDALFAEAMISYESDWLISISFFESYLALNPESVTALIYLSKLYLWSDRVEQALALTSKATEYAKESKNIAHISLIQGRIAAKQKKWQQAHKFYQQAASIVENTNDWFLKASIAEAQGLAYFAQGLFDNSIQSFNKALSFYQIIQGPIGINSTLLSLANVLSKQGKQKEAKEYYFQAKQNIEAIELDFLYSKLAEFESNNSETIGNN